MTDQAQISNSPLVPNDQIDAANKASANLTDAVTAWSSEVLKEILSKPDASRVAAADEAFGKLWAVLNNAGMNNRNIHGVLSFAQATERLAHAFLIDGSPWKSIHKGAFFYNMGLMYFSISEVDRAFKFFLLADEEDTTHKSATPGDLFRNKSIFVDLRTRFVEYWIKKVHSRFHDGLTPENRVDLLATAVSVLPQRYLLARCHLGVLRACVIHLQALSGLHPPFVEYLMTVEDLAVLSEAAARMRHEGVWAYTTGAMLGSMLASGPLPTLGFALPTPKVEISNQTAFRQALVDAGSGDMKAIAGVVKAVRNQSAHATDFPGWYLEPAVLEQVMFVQLDFITTILANLSKTTPPPAFTKPASTSGTTAPPSALTGPSGSLGS